MDQPTDPATTAAPVAGSRRRARGAVWIAGAAIGVVLVVTLALAGASALGVRGHLEQGRAALSRGRSAFVGGDAAAAKAQFANAGVAFHAAADEARSPWLTVAGVIPLLGRTPDAVRAIIQPNPLPERAAGEMLASEPRES